MIAAQELKIRGTPHQAEASGTLNAWRVQKGQIVEVGDVLATVRSAKNGGYVVKAACSGVIRAIIAPAGKKLAAGEVVCYIESQSAPAPPQRTPAPRARENTSVTGSASQPSTMPAKRQSTLPAVEDSSIPATATKIDERPKRGRTTHQTYHLSEDQVKRIKRLSLEMKLDEEAPNCNESELVRAAVEMLLSLPQPALLQWVEENRRREEAGRYGTGFPRPGKRRKGAK
jgi:pyruvate/2-oxoglutarate dehydrogenase complex dihydrolipoamide acyltransferase (E2) component